jgi:hypothetical protein
VDVQRRLTDLTSLLASYRFPALPSGVQLRIEQALASEAASRFRARTRDARASRPQRPNSQNDYWPDYRVPRPREAAA